MAAWSITIVAGPAAFTPQNLFADPGDVVSFNNTTATVHQPYQIDSTGVAAPVPLGGNLWLPIQPGDQSPAWTIPQLKSGTVIHYRCLLHPGEVGTITIN
jgi:plastocyanin